jgi:hypothetical protein
MKTIIKIFFFIMIISLFPAYAFAELRPDDRESCGCRIGYPLLYSTTLFIPGLLGLNIFLPTDETWHAFSFENFLDAYQSPPRFDKDSWVFNYFLHPLWGSETYIRARCNGCSWWQSWLFSNAMSILWEYGFESWNEHPSIQDLLITGNAGSVIGEIRYRLIMHLKRKKSSIVINSFIFFLDPIQSTLDCILSWVEKE